MGYRIKMPKLEQGMQQGILIAWLVDLGAEITEGDPIAEIESEKTSTDIEAREDGVLRRIFVEPGETVSPGTTLGIVAGPDESIEELEESVNAEAVEASAEPSQETPERETTTIEAESETVAKSATAKAEADDEAEHAASDEKQAPAKVSPAARRRAEELDVDLGTVEGTGPDGAVVSEDIERSIERAGEATEEARQLAEELGIDLASVDGTGPRGAVTVADVEAVSDGVRERRELTGMRRTIADRLGRSHREAPHVTVHREVDVEELIKAANLADRYADVDVSVTDLLLLSVSATLADHPKFNGTFEDDIHTIYHDQHIGVAVDIEGGLVTPVIENTDSLSLDELVTRRQSLTQKVLDGDYTGDDITGGTFTVSNLGGFGVDSFTPIINPPEVAILGVDRISEEPVPEDGGVAFRRHIGFDLSFDHRVVDGADAARFLATLAEHVGDPLPLLLDRV
jgi:pyruvate/2-oxoglutarate dehydrogenase complex dihydrolipoamide acyltransferase (E2) component